MKVGAKVLITTDAFFYAPDGNAYRAVWGTVRSLNDDQSSLGIRTNARSTNWYLLIGNMLIAGCQIHYAIECGYPNTDVIVDDDGKQIMTRIYIAD